MRTMVRWPQLNEGIVVVVHFLDISLQAGKVFTEGQKARRPVAAATAGFVQIQFSEQSNQVKWTRICTSIV